MDREGALRRFEDQLLLLFSSLQAGRDVAPARHYRLEGFADALVALELVSETALAGMIDTAYRQVFGEAPPASADASTRIPCIMARAPVYPSTGEG